MNRPNGIDEATDGDWAEVLAAFPLFSGVSRRRLRKLVRHAKFLEFARGDSILANANWLYVILGGTAKAGRKPAGRELGVGDYFGELAPGSANVVATQQLHVMRLPSQSVMRLARRHPSIALVMLRNLSAQLHVDPAVPERSVA